MKEHLAILLVASAASGQAPVFRSETSVVEVAVIAKDSKEAPLTDLKKSDLTLFDNGVRQTILSFERLDGIVRTTGKPRERLTIILLDALNTPWATQVSARNAVLQVFAKMSPGPDRIAIFALGDQLRLLHDFTEDAATLRASVERYGGELAAAGVDDPLAPSEGHVSAPAPSIGPPGGRDVMSVRAPNTDATDPARQEQRLLRTLEALTTIARMVKSAPGEKNLLWATAGFPPPAKHDVIETAMRELTAAKLMLYPIDARGVIAGMRSFVAAGSLKELAEQTGGRVYFNGNGVASFVQGAFEDSREGYVLTYSPRDYKQDGSAHLVVLKTSRKDLALRYRPGYVADRPK